MLMRQLFYTKACWIHVLTDPAKSLLLKVSKQFTFHEQQHNPYTISIRTQSCLTFVDRDTMYFTSVIHHFVLPWK